MRPLHLLLASALVVVPLAACSATYGDDGKPGIAPTGQGGERHYAVSGFDKVALGAAGDVTVRTGQAFGLTVTGEPGQLDTLKVTRDGSTLTLGHKAGTHWSGSGKIHWVVTMPRIAGADIGGSGSIRIDRAEGQDFHGNIGGSGDLSVAGLKVDRAVFAIGGSGNIDAAGQARAIDLSIGGSGKLRALPVTADTAKVTIAGAGDVAATVKTHADVTIVGSGNVEIAGGAKCSVTKMGAGTVRCG